MYQVKHSSEEHKESESEAESKAEIVTLCLESIGPSNCFSAQTNEVSTNIFINNLSDINTEELIYPENNKIAYNILNTNEMKNETYIQELKIKEEIVNNENVVFKINDILNNTVEDILKTEPNEGLKLVNVNIPCIKSENIVFDSVNKTYYTIEYTGDENSVIGHVEIHAEKWDRNEPTVNAKDNDEVQPQEPQILFIDYANGNTQISPLITNRNEALKKLLSGKSEMCDYGTENVTSLKKSAVSQPAHNSTVIKNEKPLNVEKPHACTFCDFRSKRKLHLDDHLRTHTGEKPFLCNTCDYKCSKKSSLTRHEKIHTGQQPYECKFCDFKSCIKQSLTRHYKQHFGEKIFACQYCHYKCLRMSLLLRHERVHTGEKPFACNYCDYKSSNKSNLITHSRQHTGEKPYACKYCDYRSSDKSHLITHCRQHTGEKPYVCDKCNYKSCNRANLITHSRQHTGVKPYACKYCNYKSITKSNLVTHTRQHTGEKPYACQYCDYRSSNQANLTTHSSHHREVIKQT